MAEYEKLARDLREDAEWAEANQWETPIMLSDHLKQAVEAIEELSSLLQNANNRQGVETGERKYVIVSNEHDAWPNGALLFWGRRTEDDQERSFGGYTTNFYQCERYTREEIEKWRGVRKAQYPFFDEVQPISRRSFKQYSEVICTLEDLESLGWKLWNVVMVA